MADPVTPPVDPTAIVDPSNEPDPPELGDPGKKALDKERKARRDAEARLKELEPIAQKAKELEDAQKSEAEKLNEKVADAEGRATSAELSALRMEVALDKAPDGMSLTQLRKLAKRLTGTTRDELESDADELFEDFFTEDEDDDAPPSRQPKENLRPGRKGKEPSVNDDPLLVALKARSGA